MQVCVVEAVGIRGVMVRFFFFYGVAAFSAHDAFFLPPGCFLNCKKLGISVVGARYIVLAVKGKVKNQKPTNLSFSTFFVLKSCGNVGNNGYICVIKVSLRRHWKAE